MHPPRIADRMPHLMRDDGWGGMVGFHPLVHLLLTIALVVGVILLVIWLVRSIRQNPIQAQPPAASQFGPLDQVRMRYARGEITREEFVRLNQDLGGPPPPHE